MTKPNHGHSSLAPGDHENEVESILDPSIEPVSIYYLKTRQGNMAIMVTLQVTGWRTSNIHMEYICHFYHTIIMTNLRKQWKEIGSLFCTKPVLFIPVTIAYYSSCYAHTL